MGRGSKIKHIEKNSYSKFKQVLVKKEDKKSSKEKSHTSKGKEENIETPEIPQNLESSKKNDELESPNKLDEIEKSPKRKELQVENQKSAETIEAHGMQTEQQEKTEMPEVPQIFETSYITKENNGYKETDKVETSQEPDILASQSQDSPEIPMRPEMTKWSEVLKKTVKKPVSLDRPYQHDSAKKPDSPRFQRPDLIQTKSRDKFETPSKPETPKRQRKKAKWAEKAQKFECRYENLESRKTPDRLEKSHVSDRPSVKNQETSEICNKGPATPKMQRNKIKCSEEPQKTEIPNRCPEYVSPKTINGLDKPQMLDEAKVKSGNKPESSMPNTREKIKSPEKFDHDQLENPDRLNHMSETSRLIKIPEKCERVDESERHENTDRLENSQNSENPDAEKPREVEKFLDKQLLKHPLENSWGIWLITNDKRNWEDNLVKLATFNTVEDYWCLYHYMKLPSELERGKDYAVFKDKYRPMWEDAANRGGGRWLINFDKRHNEPSDLDSIWMFVVLLVIGESFHVPDSICGTVVSLRVKNRIAVWVPNYKNELAVREVGQTLRNVLGLRGRLSFQQHNTTTSIFTL